jgi:hypothetical protein
MSRNTNDALNHGGLRSLRKEWIVLGLLLAPALVLIGSGAAQAGMCFIPAEEGNWTNYDSNTRGITKLEFRMECRSLPDPPCSGGLCTSTSAVAPHYFIHLYGSCSPTDCNWGEVEGERLSGSLDGWYRFIYDHGFARRYVYARTYQQWPGWLRLWIYTDFVDPGRADYVMDDWFR